MENQNMRNGEENLKEAMENWNNRPAPIAILDLSGSDSCEKGLHDNRVRAALNQGHKKEREPLEVLAERYIAENPAIWEMFVKFTNQAIKSGWKHFGVAVVFERMRWEANVSGNDGFKVNNNYRAYFARKFMKENPEHEGFFSIRATSTEKAQDMQVDG